MNRSRVSRRNFLWIAGGSLALVGGCGGRSSSEGGSSDASGAAEKTLNFHNHVIAPNTLDPARVGAWNSLAYDVLIYRNYRGEYEPRIARDWKYVGEGNTVFEISLRPDVKFVDGELVTAEAVKKNIEYRQDPSVASPSASHLAAISEIEIVDELTLRINLSEPNPLMPRVFSQQLGGPGILISPAAIEKPETLATDVFGVSRYTLDLEETVQGNHYSYIRNPNYWRPDDVYWDKVILHYMPEESAALASIQTGQLQAARISFQTVKAGRDAGLSVTGPGTPIVLGLNLIDRGGKVVPELADIRVRQALNLAIDRQKISDALIGESGRPIDQMSAPGFEGWHEDGFYPFDPDSARQLLADAGFAEGFDLPTRINRDHSELVRLTEAVANDLRQINVILDIDAVPASEFNQADVENNRNYGAIQLGWGVEPPFEMAKNFWLPDAPNNIFGNEDEQLVELNASLSAASDKDQPALNSEIVERVTELGWFLPVVIFGESVLYDESAVTLPWEDFASVPTAAELRPAEG